MRSGWPLSAVIPASLALVCTLQPGCQTRAKSQPISATTASTSASAPVHADTPAKATSQSPAQFPRPELDLPADRLHEHVDGAEPALQALGCRRLLFWHLTNPSVDLEVLVFNTESGARAALDKDSGSARTNDTPGDEGWTNQQVVYFRRGTAYCRLIADQPPPVPGLAHQARRVDAALKSGQIRL